MDETGGHTETNEQTSDLRTIKHDINNVLTGILGHTQLLKLRGELNERSRERVEKIEELANRLSEIAAGLNEKN